MTLPRNAIAAGSNVCNRNGKKTSNVFYWDKSEVEALVRSIAKELAVLGGKLIRDRSQRCKGDWLLGYESAGPQLPQARLDDPEAAIALIEKDCIPKGSVAEMEYQR